MKYNSHLTAISRKAIPAPTRWLIANDKVPTQPGDLNVLDFGCGKCLSVNPVTWDNYDPHYRPWSVWHKQWYDIIICNYVLCTLPAKERLSVMQEIQKKLYKTGVAYVSVRTDKPRQGWGLRSKGTYQGKVELPLEIIYKNSQFCIYVLTKSTRLV